MTFWSCRYFLFNPRVASIFSNSVQNYQLLVGTLHKGDAKNYQGKKGPTQIGFGEMKILFSACDLCNKNQLSQYYERWMYKFSRGPKIAFNNRIGQIVRPSKPL